MTTLFRPLAPLHRSTLEELMTAHRQAFIDAFIEYVPDATREEAHRALDDFEAGILKEADCG